MHEFIKILFSLSVSGTLLLLLILGLKLLYNNKFSRRWQYYIWIIVVLRFLLPFTPNTLNIGNLLEKFYTAVITSENPTSPNIPITEDINNNKTKQILTKTQANENIITAAADSSLDIYICLFFVWSAFALVLFVRKITIYQGFIRYIKAGNTEVSDINTLNLLSDCEEKLNIKTRVELYHNTLIASPIMIGFFRPNIVLPVKELENKELSYIFVHELLHYQRRDLFYKWLIQIVICIHWFNPFIYLLEKEVNKACELSCDETVISILGDEAKREYGDMLINFVTSNNLYKGSFSSVTLSEGAEQLKERLGAIINYKKKTKTIRILTGILTLCIIFGAAFVGIYPVAAAPHLTPVKTNTPAISVEKNYETDTYIYGDDPDDKWDWDKQDWDWNDEDWNEQDWNWDDKEWDEDLYEKALLDAYAAHGIETDGKSYYYQGELVFIIKDQRPDSSFYMLNTNSKGTVSIKVVRNAEGEITGVSYITEEEVAEILPKILNAE